MEWILEAEDFDDFINGRAAIKQKVVRCKECAYYDTHDKRCKYWNHGVYVFDYCSKSIMRTPNIWGDE